MSLPIAAGIGLRAPHVQQVLDRLPAVPWFEIHSENYFAEGGPALAKLVRIRADYPIAMHGVGLSLGSADPLDREHLRKLKRLADRIDPALVSEHLCWSSIGDRHYNDLLPLPYNEEALAHVCARVSAVQDNLGRAIAIENVSSYYAFPEATLPECEFVAAVAARTGCKLLIDVNNIYVNARNQGLDPQAYLAAIPPSSVAEIHLAGFDASGPTVIDTHGAPVAPEVWSLYAAAIDRFGSVPTLIEWDTDIPELAVLLREAATAQHVLSSHDALAAELQRRFATALLDDGGADPRIGIYRNTIFANYRNALGATYRVVRELIGAPFFNTAVDAFVRAHPSTGGDLNVYGEGFADFLASYPHARDLAYLPDVARLEWALDEAHRAADSSGSPESTLAALAAVPLPQVARQRFVLDPSCRLLHSPHPVFRIWQVHQAAHEGDGRVDWSLGADYLLIRREGEMPSIERLQPGDYAWLSSLAIGSDLATALDAALALDATFDLGTAVRAHIASGTLTAMASPG